MRDFRSLTLEELREAVDSAIEKFGGETLVGFSCNYGDYSRTMQILPFTYDDPVVAGVIESGYSQSGFALVLDDHQCPACESERITVRETQGECAACGYTWTQEERQQVVAFMYDRP